jgi:hypothetical protein
MAVFMSSVIWFLSDIGGFLKVGTAEKLKSPPERPQASFLAS